MKELLERQDRLMLLIKSAQFYTPKELLTMLSKIRDNIINDESITIACRNDEQAATLRKDLLEQIKEYQIALINSATFREEIRDVNGNATVENFDEAKAALARLIDDEKRTFNDYIQNNSSHLLLNNDFIDHQNRLDVVYNNCVNGHYKLLIVSEYQSGKTTTFNTICDGVDIGAIGRGEATTAVPVSIINGKEKEVNIIWKGDKEIEAFMEHLKPHFEDFHASSFDLFDPDSREQWLKNIKKLRTSEEIEQIPEEEIKFIALCSLVLKWFDSDSLKDYKNQDHTFDHIAPITQFPKNFEQTWLKYGVNAFSLHDSLFMFIEQISITIPSSTSKYLNCEIIDSPGLFHGDFDTEITRKLMKEADAILYIMPYHKGYGKEIEKSLESIMYNYPDALRKLFFIHNLSFIQNTEFYNTDVARVQRIFGKQMQVLPYDAQLAYIGSVKKSSESIDNYTRQSFIHKFPKDSGKPLARLRGKREYFDTFEEALEHAIKKYETGLSLNLENYEEIIEESGFNEILKELKDFIDRNKSYSIIYSNGLMRLQTGSYKTLNCLELEYVEPYVVGSKNAAKIWESRICKSKSFNESELTRIIEKHLFVNIDGNRSLFDRIGDEAYKELFPENVYSSMIERIASEVFENKMSIYKKRKNENELKEFITPIVSKVITDVINERFERLNGGSPCFNETFSFGIRGMKMELAERWESIFKDDLGFKNRICDYIEYPQNIDNMSGSDQTVDVSSVKDKLLGTIALQIVIISTSIAMIVSGYLVLWISEALLASGAAVSNPLTLMIALIGGGVVVGIGGVGEIKKRFINKISAQIREEFCKQKLYDKFKKMTDDAVKGIMKTYASGISVNVANIEKTRDVALSQPEKKMEENCFTAVSDIIELKEQNSRYSEFSNKYIKE